MADIVSPDVRSRMMSGIRARNTKPEMLLRRALHARGLRFRLHRKDLPGKPDLVFPKWRAVVFVHGCFWHGHDCPLYREPGTRTEFWRAKIETNRRNDARAEALLREVGWRVATVWECAMRGKPEAPEHIAARVGDWLDSQQDAMEVRG
ncbi:MAG: very short patch repair endonuclease [Pseudoxanthomonas sp.]